MQKEVKSIKYCGGAHRRNLANKIGGGGAKSTIIIRNFNLQRSPVRKRGKIGLIQSSIFIHPFPPLIPIFYLPLFQF
jgi:hypothetical protein